jgi:choline dehydrogenase
MQMTVKKGIRCSSYRAYLHKISKRKNLRILTNVLVDKVCVQNNRANAIKVIINGNEFQYKAAKEIILSAGSIGSPAILQRSGIGDKKLLAKLGINLIKHLPGVGQNLQDHLEVYFQYQCKKPVTLNNKLGYLRKLLIGIQWFFFKKGLGITNHFESCGFIRSKCGITAPDIQYHFLPAAIRYDGTQAIDDHGFQVHVGPNKPKSRGSVNITSKSCYDSPDILFNYLQHKDDILDWRQCIQLTREIMMQPAMDNFRGQIIQPDINISSNYEIDEWVKQNAESAYHPCGTCKMGKTDNEFSVVDNKCQVIGIDKLRVVDSSIFPTITNGNINATTMMVAEKAADIIKDIESPKILEVSVWKPLFWKERQRDGESSRKI